METAPHQNKSQHGVSVFAFVFGMLVTFMVGLYVGLHPAWIPIKLGNFADAVTDQPSPAKSFSRPTSEPSETPATDKPQGESSQSH
jgi:hypothetical protein